jgi:hypothetical protein
LFIGKGVGPSSSGQVWEDAMLVSLDLGDVAVLVAQMQDAERSHLERADASDDPVTAAAFRDAAGRCARIVESLTGTVHRWHEFDRSLRGRVDLSLAGASL